MLATINNEAGPFLQADVGTLTIIFGTVLPIVVGVVTKKVASRALKAISLLFLSAVAGVVAQAIGDDGILTLESVRAAAVTFVTGAATYYGFWKPSSVAEMVQDATARIGIGSANHELP